MKIKELIKMLEELNDPEAVIDMASDEEGNSFGDIGQGVAESTLKSTGETVYTIYPETCEDGLERYND